MAGMKKRRERILKMLDESGDAPVEYNGRIYTKEYRLAGQRVASALVPACKVADSDSELPVYQPRTDLGAVGGEKVSSTDMVPTETVEYENGLDWQTENCRPRVWEHFLGVMCQGGKLTEYCRANLIPLGAMFRFMREGGRKTEYEEAKQIFAQSLVDDIIGIADGGGDPVQAKLRVESRKWVAGKYDRGRFGEKTVVDGEIGLTVMVKKFGRELGGGTDGA